jgi:hypothetical protein
VLSVNEALAFSSGLSLDEIRRRLEQVTSWNWLPREGERRGEYLSAMVRPGVMVRVYVEPARYVFDVDCNSVEGGQGDYEALLAMVATGIIPALGGSDIRRIDGYGR